MLGAFLVRLSSQEKLVVINLLSDSLLVFAQAAEGSAPAGGGLTSFLIFIPLFGILYFMMIRPQQKKQKEQAEMQKALMAGDKIRTVGGILGTVKGVTETTIKVEVAEGVVIEFLRGAVDRKIDDSAAAKPAEKK